VACGHSRRVVSGDHDGYPALVTTVLGLFGLVIFAACVIALAAGVTWLVVKLIPAERPERGQETG